MKRVAVAIVFLALAFASLIVVRSWRFALSQLHPPRVAVPEAPPISGLTHVEFAEPNGIVLRGWWVPSKNQAAVILLHGFSSNRAQMLPELELLVKHGFGVLAFDLPGHGASGGDLVTWGDREQMSLVTAITFVAHLPGVDPDRIGALGFSMGGSTVIEVGAVDPRLKAVVATGTYTTLTDELDHEASKWGPLSQIPVKKAMQLNGVAVDRVHPIDVICKISPRPVLLIDGTDDVSTPVDMEARLFAAACEPKALWLVPGAHHGDYARVDGPEYERRLVFLFDSALVK